jgi:P-type Cu+ transporter
MKETIDPVCGMQVDPKRAAGMTRVEGQSFYFCSLRCNAAFDADPKNFGIREAPAVASGSCCGGSRTSCR